MIAAEAPPEPVEVVEAAPVQAAADFVVVSRNDSMEIVATADLPIGLVKAGRTEEALLRQAIFISASIVVTRPIAPPDAPPPTDSYRWTYESFLQRQLCFTSLSGMFGCATAEVTTLPEKVTGLAPAAVPEPGADPSFPAAEAARRALEESLRARAPAMFDADKRTKIDPVLRAAGVTVQARRSN